MIVRMVATSRANLDSAVAGFEMLANVRGPLVRFTVADILAMLRERILREDSATELLDGLVLFKNRADSGGDVVSHGPRHRLCIRRLTKLASAIDAPDSHAQVQLPLICGEEQMPEPDFAIIAGQDESFADKLPSASDATCVIEVADSSYERDLEQKGPIYAAASVPQYLIVNLRNGTVEQYTDADPVSRTYRTKLTFIAGQSVTLHLPGGSQLSVPVTELLP